MSIETDEGRETAVSAETACYTDLSDREIDIIRVAYGRLLDLLEGMPSPVGLEGVPPLSERDKEMMRHGAESVSEMLRWLLLDLLMDQIGVDRRISVNAGNAV